MSKRQEFSFVLFLLGGDEDMNLSCQIEICTGNHCMKDACPNTQMDEAYRFYKPLAYRSNRN